MQDKKTERAFAREERRLSTVMTTTAAKHRRETKPQVSKRDPKRHLKSCECVRCLRRKVEEYKAKVDAMFTPRPPVDSEQMIPVRAHFRKHPRYLASQPVLQQIVYAFAVSMVKSFK